MKTLPNKTSELIRLAVSDLEKCEKDKSYEINMCAWHTENYDSCAVCLAGSVMAKTLEEDWGAHIEPYNYDIDTCVKLNVLNDIRISMNTEYRDNPKRFKEELLEIVEQYENMGD